MKKSFWSHLSFFLVGAILTAVVFAKWFVGDDYSVEIDKIKNKKTLGDNTVNATVKAVKESRKRKREKPKKERRRKRKNDQP